MAQILRRTNPGSKILKQVLVTDLYVEIVLFKVGYSNLDFLFLSKLSLFPFSIQVIKIGRCE
jgi:hypothetical protein